MHKITVIYIAATKFKMSSNQVVKSYTVCTQEFKQSRSIRKKQDGNHY